MPNGFHDDPTIDLLIHRHTEHKNPQFFTERAGGGILSVHLWHDRGYAYTPDWSKVDLRPLAWSRGKRPSRAEMDAVAVELVEKVTAVMSSNPSSIVDAQWASAFLALHDWCVLLGDYHLYVRSGDGVFQRIEHPASRDPEMLKMVARVPTLADNLHRTQVVAGRGLPYHAPGDCVHDLAPADAWIATTVPLHDLPEWDEIVRAPLDSVESAGNIVLATRRHAVDRGTDHIVILRRRPGAAKAGAAKGPTSASARALAMQPTSVEDDKAAHLLMTWGPDIGRPFLLAPECLLGRGKECDVLLDDDRASRRHARISKVAGRYFLRDLGSTNGTFVNDIPVTGERELQDGDRLHLGGHHFRFEVDGGVLWDGHIHAAREAPLVEALDKAEGLWERGEGDVSLVILDVDRMKLVNDMHGFPAGDRVLAHIHSVARECVRPEDTVARLGEEIAIVLPGLGEAGAREVAERIRKAIAERPAEVDGREIRATVSCGVAWFRPLLTRAWQVRRAAEGRLFEAKLAGRNQVK